MRRELDAHAFGTGRQKSRPARNVVPENTDQAPEAVLSPRLAPMSSVTARETA
jgi:hypothetical protein